MLIYFYLKDLLAFQNKYIDNTSKIYKIWWRQGQIQMTPTVPLIK